MNEFEKKHDLDESQAVDAAQQEILTSAFESTETVDSVEQINDTMDETVNADSIYDNNKVQSDSADLISNTHSDTNESADYSKNKLNENVIPEKISAEKASSTGVKVFCVILAIVLVMSVCLTVGYITGTNYSNFSNKSSASLNLESKPKDADTLNDAQIYDKVSSCVVSVMVYNSKSSSRVLASGIIYNKDGYIIINDHIYANIQSPQFLVTTKDGTEYKAEYVGGDIKSDIAVLKINAGSQLTPATFGDSSQVVVGEQVSAVGYSGASQTTALIASGIVNASEIRFNNSSAYSEKYIQTDIATNTVGSGGALSNVYGQIIGITAARKFDNEQTTVTLAVPTTTIAAVAQSLITDGRVVGRARLGINYTFVDSVYSELNQYPVGVYIVSISSDSNLSNTDVKEGDVITYINDTKITNSEIVLDIIENCNAGDVVNLTVYNKDNDTTKNYSVKLAEDTGSSSYTDLPVEDDDIDSDSSQSEDGQYKKEFDFPLGE
ncbi:MAG: S1C family serine protease [bacterium]|nr:S1C family serine protease [bacterium]